MLSDFETSTSCSSSVRSLPSSSIRRRQPRRLGSMAAVACIAYAARGWTELVPRSSYAFSMPVAESPSATHLRQSSPDVNQASEPLVVRRPRKSADASYISSLKESGSVDEVLELCRQRLEGINAAELAALLETLLRLDDSKVAEWPKLKNSEVLQQLLLSAEKDVSEVTELKESNLLPFAASADHCEALTSRGLAECQVLHDSLVRVLASALASYKSRTVDLIHLLQTPLVARHAAVRKAAFALIAKRMNFFGPLLLTQLASVLASVPQIREEGTDMFIAVTKAIGNKLDDFDASALAKTMHYLADVQLSHTSLLEKFAMYVSLNIGFYSAQELVIISDIMARSTFKTSQFVSAFYKATNWKMQKMSGEEVAAILRYFVVVNEKDERVLQVSATHALELMQKKELSLQALSEILWAYASLGYLSDSFSDAAAKQAIAEGVSQAQIPGLTHHSLAAWLWLSESAHGNAFSEDFREALKAEASKREGFVPISAK